jgi:hypothetical protein
MRTNGEQGRPHQWQRQGDCGGVLSAFLLAVDVAAIAAAADQHLSAAARAQKESPSGICLSGFVTQTWTKSATGGILPGIRAQHDVGRGADTTCEVGIGAAPVLNEDRDLAHHLQLSV